MDSARIEFDRNHEKGCGLFSKNYQSSAAAIQPFMNEFSPIIQVVRDFGAPYGGLAMGTVTLLFAVAGNKNTMEETLASTISAIQDRLSGLRLYQHIYNERDELDMKLQAHIVAAYQDFIAFCILATKYYKSSGWRKTSSLVRRNASFLSD
ncbi:MAG: hypothetical protein Q9210_001858 [Variospora velana]